MITIGIDPGIGGAACVLRGSDILVIYDTPVIKVGDKQEYDTSRMAQMLHPTEQYAERPIVFIEKVHVIGPRPGHAGMGAVGAFNFGKGFGMWLGIIAAYSLTHEQVSPQRWKKAMMPDMPSEKGASIEIAKRLYPERSLALFARKKDHGRADALLIALYGYRRRSGLISLSQPSSLPRIAQEPLEAESAAQ